MEEEEEAEDVQATRSVQIPEGCGMEIPSFLSQVAGLGAAADISQCDEEPCGCNEARAKRGNMLPAL